MSDTETETGNETRTKAPDGTDALLEALAANLDGAFECLVHAYQQRIYGFTLRLAGNSADAEELAQDAFVRAYRALASYPSERIRALALRPWLYQIALNLARNHARDSKRERQLVALPLDRLDDPPADGLAAQHEPEDDPALRPEALAEAGERRRELEHRLEALPMRFRAAVVLRHVEGFSYGEIAALLGQPVGTVKANVHRGVRLLRAGLLVAQREGVEA